MSTHYVAQRYYVGQLTKNLGPYAMSGMRVLGTAIVEKEDTSRWSWWVTVNIKTNNVNVFELSGTAVSLFDAQAKAHKTMTTLLDAQLSPSTSWELQKIEVPTPQAPPQAPSPQEPPPPAPPPQEDVAEDRSYQIVYSKKPVRGGNWIVRGLGFNKFYGFPSAQAARAAVEAKLFKLAQRDLAVAQAMAWDPNSAEGARFGLEPRFLSRADELAFQKPLLKKKETVAGATYSAADVMRLLDRASIDNFKLVARMLERMLERQTADERAAQDARYLNARGFTKPDAHTAEKLWEEYKRLEAALFKPQKAVTACHYDMARLLMKYSNRQLLEFMNEGAREHGRIVRTNPWGRQNPEFKVFHADHGINPDQMSYIQQMLAFEDFTTSGFFIRQIILPHHLGTVPNALYGPDSGDAPVAESKVYYKDRAGRGWKDRMISLPPRPTRQVQVIGIRDGDAFTLFTVYGGPLAPQNPADPSNQDPEGARRWWAQHALSDHQW